LAAYRWDGESQRVPSVVVLELFGTSSAVVHRFLLPSTLHVSAEAQDEDNHDDEDDQESKQGKVLLV
jgi:hypothetical protein